MATSTTVASPHDWLRDAVAAALEDSASAASMRTPQARGLGYAVTGPQGHVTKVRIALAGDTMLGRSVATMLRDDPSRPLVSEEIVEVATSADLFVLNLECCISERGSPSRHPGKPFFFRAPPSAIRVLQDVGVSCVTLANNHALDFGVEGLVDTVRFLDDVGIRHVGAGRDLAEARAHAALEARGLRIAVFGITDHPADYAAGPDRPGVAVADLRHGVPHWLTDS